MRLRLAPIAIAVLALLLAVAVLGHAGRTGIATAQTPLAFSGTTPGPGQIGLLVTATETTPPTSSARCETRDASQPR